ncbi:unnamed protein product [Pseudo-nitzschia multistriata]|uniref:NADP-dependent oxidoreductase domain-containing protein n=1 Tax=Pseudo-nitzschia multistriata TaxID=183589 RepID=A0A448YVR7_9STRA|nr:unnamed protein product [Pseudo-nitzschia multistriata]
MHTTRRQLCFLVASLLSPSRSNCFKQSLAIFSMSSRSPRGKRKSSSLTSSLTTMKDCAEKTDDSNRETEGQKRSHHTFGMAPMKSSIFRETAIADANSLTDGVKLRSMNDNESTDSVILPFIGYGTYKLGREIARSKTLEAFEQGYRCIDTAFIYGGETIETQVGLAIQDAIEQKILENGRNDLFVITKHWRKYHGYEETNQCLRLSLRRLKLDYIDLWLMHWPGPAWNTMNRRKDLIKEYGPWHYAVHSEKDMPRIRAETWRAMEDAMKSGKVKAIGVCNFTIKHLESLKKTASIWPPAVNQIECHPLFPQKELVEYCRKEGIVVQAYSSLGGQDVGKKFWRTLYPPPPKKRGESKPESVTKLSNTPPVLNLSKEKNRTSAQILLRWALDKNFVVIPKTSSKERMLENAGIFDFSLSTYELDKLESELEHALFEVAKAEKKDVDSMARLCWRNDPLRDLLFD